MFDAVLRERVTSNLARFNVVERDGHGLRHAAVGVVILADATRGASIVLTRRVTTLRRHAGQWALPGGRLEPGETIEQAALREIFEEIGLELQPDAVLGRLDDFVSRSGHLISPLVIWAEGAREVVANPEEVEAAYLVPLEEIERRDALRTRPMLHFAVPSLPTTLHAPTAAIVYQFREVALHGRDVRVADVEQPRFAWS